MYTHTPPPPPTHTQTQIQHIFNIYYALYKCMNTYGLGLLLQRKRKRNVRRGKKNPRRPTAFPRKLLARTLLQMQNPFLPLALMRDQPHMAMPLQYYLLRRKSRNLLPNIHPAKNRTSPLPMITLQKRETNTRVLTSPHQSIPLITAASTRRVTAPRKVMIVTVQNRAKTTTLLQTNTNSHLLTNTNNRLLTNTNLHLQTNILQKKRALPPTN